MAYSNHRENSHDSMFLRAQVQVEEERNKVLLSKVADFNDLTTDLRRVTSEEEDLKDRYSRSIQDTQIYKVQASELEKRGASLQSRNVELDGLICIAEREAPMQGRGSVRRMTSSPPNTPRRAVATVSQQRFLASSRSTSAMELKSARLCLADELALFSRAASEWNSLRSTLSAKLDSAVAIQRKAELEVASLTSSVAALSKKSTLPLQNHRRCLSTQSVDRTPSRAIDARAELLATDVATVQASLNDLLAREESLRADLARVNHERVIAVADAAAQHNSVVARNRARFEQKVAEMTAQAVEHAKTRLSWNEQNVLSSKVGDSVLSSDPLVLTLPVAAAIEQQNALRDAICALKRAQQNQRRVICAATQQCLFKAAASPLGGAEDRYRSLVAMLKHRGLTVAEALLAFNLADARRTALESSEIVIPAVNEAHVAAASSSVGSAEAAAASLWGAISDIVTTRREREKNDTFPLTTLNDSSASEDPPQSGAPVTPAAAISFLHGCGDLLLGSTGVLVASNLNPCAFSGHIAPFSSSSSAFRIETNLDSMHVSNRATSFHRFPHLHDILTRGSDSTPRSGLPIAPLNLAASKSGVNFQQPPLSARF